MSSSRSAGSRDLQEVGLDALEEAVRAGSLAVEIDWPSEPLLEKELEVHETGESGRQVEIDEEIEIVRLRFTTRGGSKQPKFFNTECTKFGLPMLNG